MLHDTAFGDSVLSFLLLSGQVSLFLRIMLRKNRTKNALAQVTPQSLLPPFSSIQDPISWNGDIHSRSSQHNRPKQCKPSQARPVTTLGTIPYSYAQKLFLGDSRSCMVDHFRHHNPTQRANHQPAFHSICSTPISRSISFKNKH